MPRRTYTGEIAPDHLRCKRSDGRKWRCPLHAMEGLTFCEHHYQMSRRHLTKNHRPSPSSASSADPVNPAKKRSRAPRPPSSEPAKRRRRGRTPTAADKEPLGGTIKRRAVKDEREKRMESPEALEEADEEEGDIVRDLPNGVMTISPPPKKDRRGNVFPPFAAELEIEEGFSALRRPIRSKNAEPIPVATVKRIPPVKGLLRRRRKKACHTCGVKIVEHMIQCSICRTGFFCSSCIKKRFFYLSQKEVKRACPICRGCCDCEPCKHAKGEEGDKTKASSPDLSGKSCEHDGYNDGENSGAKDEESTKQETEAEETRCQGRSSSTRTRLVEKKLVNCNFCNARLAGFEGSCSTCIGFV